MKSVDGQQHDIKTLLQYYMASEGDASRFCKNATWDGYCYYCPHMDDDHFAVTFYCANCPHWNLDTEYALQEARAEISTALSHFPKKYAKTILV